MGRSEGSLKLVFCYSARGKTERTKSLERELIVNRGGVERLEEGVREEGREKGREG